MKLQFLKNSFAKKHNKSQTKKVLKGERLCNKNFEKYL